MNKIQHLEETNMNQKKRVPLSHIQNVNMHLRKDSQKQSDLQ